MNKAIDEINKRLTALFDEVAGVKIYGAAQTMTRTQGQERIVYPALVDFTGEGIYIGVDNDAPLIIYHKINSISTAIKPKEAYGDDPGAIANTYNNTLIVYIDRERMKMSPEELFMYIQAHFPNPFKIPPFDITVRITNVILNSLQVWASEYQKDFELPPSTSMFAVNYTIESSFKKGCFDKCIHC